MSSQHVFRYAFSSVRNYPTADEWSRVSEADFHTSLRRIGQAVLAAEVTPTWADDLLRIARAVYLVDKRAPRPRGLDPWTRHLYLWVHVTDADRWRGEPVTVLETVLRAMTSDQWHLTIEGGAPPIDAQPRLGTHAPAGVNFFSVPGPLLPLW